MVKIEKGTGYAQLFRADVQRTGTHEADHPPIHSFLDLPAVLLKNLTAIGHNEPTPVQCHAIPIVDAGLDLMMCAPTGTGKTAAFLVPIIKKCQSDGVSGSPPAVDGGPVAPAVFILAPTRELAEQICDDGLKLASETGVKLGVVCGGRPRDEQLQGLQRDGCDILIATPGRLLKDFVESNSISLSKCRILVLDEADRMFDEGKRVKNGFDKAMHWMIAHPDMPDKNCRQTLMFSATLNDERIQLMARTLMNTGYCFFYFGKMIGGANQDIEQKIIEAHRADKQSCLIEVLREDIDQFKDKDANYARKTLVFVETRKDCFRVASIISSEGLPAVALNKDLEQSERETILASFQAGERPVVVATSGVAGRGLNIPCVDHVIVMDLPTRWNINRYVHEIGRTGRLGNRGKATAFFDSHSDGGLAEALIEILRDAQQVVEPFLLEAAGIRDVGGYGGRAVVDVDKDLDDLTKTVQEMAIGVGRRDDRDWQ